jgi:hypothetical protein
MMLTERNLDILCAEAILHLLNPVHVVLICPLLINGAIPLLHLLGIVKPPLFQPLHFLLVYEASELSLITSILRRLLLADQ